jgi:transposase
MKPLTISDPALVLALQDEIRRSDEARYDHRLHAVLLVAQGQSCHSVAKSLGDSPRSVQYWTKRFELRGFAGLQASSKPGRPRALDSKQLIEVEKAIRKSPRDCGLNVNLWDGKTLSEWIQKKFKISIGVRQCQRLFRQFGFRLRKPRPMLFHKNKNEEARSEFKKKSR